MHEPSTIRLTALGTTLWSMVLLAGGGCGGPPAVSAASEEATVHGTVTYKGKAVTAGEVRFNPANIRRKNAVTRTATIGNDGHYSLTTLVGQNTITLGLPDLARKDPGLTYMVITHDVARGDSILDIELPLRQAP